MASAIRVRRRRADLRTAERLRRHRGDRLASAAIGEPPSRARAAVAFEARRDRPARSRRASDEGRRLDRRRQRANRALAPARRTKEARRDPAGRSAVRRGGAMNDVDRALRWAQGVWRASPPTDAEIQAGTDRIARRLADSRPAWPTGRTWDM